MSPRVSVLVIEYGTASHLDACLRALEATELPPDALEVIVVDNASPTPPDAMRRDHPRVRWLKSRRNLGFAGGCVLGATRARAPVIATVNPDCEVRPDWAPAILAAFDRDPRVGVVAGKLYHPGTRVLSHAGGRLFPNGRSEHRGRGEDDHGQYDEPCAVDYVCGAAIAVRRALIEEIGFLSTAYFPAYYEETELCVRARRAGWTVLYEPRAVAEHHEAVASGGAATDTFLDRYHRGRMRFVLRNLGLRRLVTEFLPTEAAFLAHVPPGERVIAARAFAGALADAWREDRGRPREDDVIEEIVPRPPPVRRARRAVERAPTSSPAADGAGVAAALEEE